MNARGTERFSDILVDSLVGKFLYSAEKSMVWFGSMVLEVLFRVLSAWFSCLEDEIVSITDKVQWISELKYCNCQTMNNRRDKNKTTTKGYD